MQQYDRLKTHYCVISILTLFIVIAASRPVNNKKLSYRRETARQLCTSFSARSVIVHFTEHCICCTTRLYNRL